MIKHFFKVLLVTALFFAMESCSGNKLVVSSVGYRSVRTTFAQPTKIPDDAKIALEYFIDSNGYLLAIVYNLTDEVMNIDQTRSFFINTNGQSISYYDPTVRTTTNGDFSSNTNTTTFNLGAISNIFGISGSLGSLLNGTTVGSGNTTGNYATNTVSVTDLPIVSIGPKGKTALSKQYEITGISETYLGKNDINTGSFLDVTKEQSPLKFSVCVTYTIGSETEPQKLVTDFYVNTKIIQPVNNGMVADAFRKIYDTKPDALVEPSYFFIVNTNIPDNIQELNMWGEYETPDTHIRYIQGSLVDYQ